MTQRPPHSGLDSLPAAGKALGMTARTPLYCIIIKVDCHTEFIIIPTSQNNLSK